MIQPHLEKCTETFGISAASASSSDISCFAHFQTLSKICKANTFCSVLGEEHLRRVEHVQQGGRVRAQRRRQPRQGLRRTSRGPHTIRDMNNNLFMF